MIWHIFIERLWSETYLLTGNDPRYIHWQVIFWDVSIDRLWFETYELTVYDLTLIYRQVKICDIFSDRLWSEMFLLTKYALWADLCGQNASFSLFLPLFGPRRATFWTFRVCQISQTDQPGCPMCRSNLVPPHFIIYGSHIAIILKMPIFALFWAFLGPFVRPKYIKNVFSITSKIQCYKK